MFQSRPDPATPFLARLRSDRGRRALGFGLALIIETLLVLALLTMIQVKRTGPDRSTLVAMNVREIPEAAPEPTRPAPQQRAQAGPQPQQPQPTQPQPTPPQPAPPAAAPPTRTVILPIQFQLAQGAPPPPPAAPVVHRVVAYGDAERVGTAPNGEPLYAAEWYRHPDDRMLHDYLSTAHGPGWGLIACRTAPDYRVEDCVPLEEYPQGSEINRSVLAAAWEFRVRPPRRGGMPLVGSWVRIRIDYEDRR